MKTQTLQSSNMVARAMIAIPGSRFPPWDVRIMAYPEGVVLDWQTGELAEGLGCYRRHEFWAAHEHWALESGDRARPERFPQIMTVTAPAQECGPQRRNRALR